jgi:2-C-methyl-D-erythritol 4-phosphate cytidylyltransferase
MHMKVTALVPAAGMGKRMGAGMNKQYLLLGGVPIVARTVRVFESAEVVDEIYLVVPEQEIPYCREAVVEAAGFRKVRGIIAGGAERQHSVINGLRGIIDHHPDDVILIHDGVRPFITPEVISAAVETARVCDGALVAVPVKDTVKEVVSGMVRGTPPRETLWLAQTPQAFRYSVILAAHEKAEREGFLGTDDSSLVERAGGEVRIVPGDYRNIKMTTPEDMILGEAFLRESDDGERKD